MIRKKIAILLTVLLLSSTVAEAKVISYELQTKNVSRKSYVTEELVGSFLQFKSGEDAQLYNEFMKDLGVGNYIAFQHHSKKYVAYEEIMNAFLGAKEKGEKFDLEEFMIQTKGMDLNDTTLTDAEKEKAKELLEQQQGGHTSSGATKDEIKDTASMIENTLESNTPILTRQEVHSVIKDVAPHSVLGDGWEEMDAYCKETNSWCMQYDYLEKLAKPYGKDVQDFETFNTQNISTFYNKGETRKKINEKYKDTETYKHLFDLDNYEKFKGVTADFSKLNRVNHATYPSLDMFTAKTKGEFPAQHQDCINGTEGHYNIQIGALGDKENRWSYMWKPYLEKEFIEEINKLRVAKGDKPLKYDVNLHSMARYSVKRSSMDFNHVRNVRTENHVQGQWHFRHWVNGCVPYWKPYKMMTDGVHDAPIGQQQYMKQQDGSLFLTKVEGHEKELFNYNGNVHAISDMELTFDSAKNWLEYWNTMYNNFYQKRTEIDLKDYNKPMNFNKDLLDPSLTKIGVGVMTELPVCEFDYNGATGVFIMTE